MADDSLNTSITLVKQWLKELSGQHAQDEISIISYVCMTSFDHKREILFIILAVPHSQRQGKYLRSSAQGKNIGHVPKNDSVAYREQSGGTDR
jgi:hypothetical protein